MYNLYHGTNGSSTSTIPPGSTCYHSIRVPFGIAILFQKHYLKNNLKYKHSAMHSQVQRGNSWALSAQTTSQYTMFLRFQLDSATAMSAARFSSTILASMWACTRTSACGLHDLLAWLGSRQSVKPVTVRTMVLPFILVLVPWYYAIVPRGEVPMVVVSTRIPWYSSTSGTMVLIVPW